MTALGIHSNGLTITTFNVIFWSIVLPVALFGVKLFFLSSKSITLLEKSQTYDRERAQRFYCLIPNECIFHVLGGVLLKRLVEVKKLLFIHYPSP